MQLARGDDHRVHKNRESFSPPAVIPTLSREFVARRISEGETGRLKEELKCQACGKGYKHISSLAKHLWEHTPEWNMTSRLLISKHQQVQLLEAASILVSLNEEDESTVNNRSAAPSTPDVESSTCCIKPELRHEYHELAPNESTYKDTKLLTPGASDSSSPSPPPIPSSSSAVHLHHHHHHHHYHHSQDKSRAVQDKSRVVQDKSRALGDKSRALTDKNRAISDKSRALPDKSRALPISMGGIAKQTLRRSSLSYNPPSSINRRFSSSLASRSAITDYLMETSTSLHEDSDGLQSPYPRARRLSNLRAPSKRESDDDDADDEDNKHDESVFGDMEDD